MLATAAVILAAGRSTRFGSNKLLADLHGRPILQHVLDLAAALPLSLTVVVLGRDTDPIERAVAWRHERIVRNHRPDDGISGSVRLGLAALADSAADRALMLLADQPRLSEAQLAPALAVAPDAARPIVVPRYGGRPGNPVLLERPAWPMAGQLTGDRGMAQLFESRPDLVRYLDLPGTNPDIDTPADLARISLAEGPARSARRAAEDRSRP